MNEVRYVCPNCGSFNTEIYDRTFCDDGIKIWCNECGFRDYVKDTSDLDSIIEKETHKCKHSRTRALRRSRAFTKAIRKKNISDSIYFSTTGHSFYPHLHQFSKNKIHCSCPLCRAKSKYSSGYNLSVSDIRKMGLRNIRRQRNGLNKLLMER